MPPSKNPFSRIISAVSVTYLNKNPAEAGPGEYLIKLYPRDFMYRAAKRASKNHLISHFIKTPDLTTFFGIPSVVATLASYFH